MYRPILIHPSPYLKSKGRTFSFLKEHFYVCDLFLIGFAIVLGIGWITYFHHFTEPLQSTVTIDLSFSALPKYTFFSMCRGILGYILSLIFSLVWGFWAAKDRVAERCLIPILDVFQSIPILGFMPGLILLLVGIFSHSNIGLELAAIMMIFTSQVWNMAFSVYHSIRVIPQDKIDCASVYRFSAWQRVKWLEIPSIIISLVWNSMISMAGGWFFLVVNESFRLGDRDFRLPGLGSYMAQAAATGDFTAMLWAIVFMIALIVFLDTFLWRPLVAWSQRFRIEETSATTYSEPFMSHIINNSFLIQQIRKMFGSLRKLHCRIKIYRKRSKSWNLARRLRKFFCLERATIVRVQGASEDKKFAAKPTLPNSNFLAVFGITRVLPATAISRLSLALLVLLLIAALAVLISKVVEISWEQWLDLGYKTSLTLLRVLSCLLFGTLIAIPLGLFIGLSETLSKQFEPILQVAASFPATLLFPIMILLFHYTGISLAFGSVLLMLMGTFWYILFNVIAGTKAMPSDLREVATTFRLKTIQKCLRLYLPSVFPYLVTGLIAGAGGAWNASIVAEYVTYKDELLEVPGIGSMINLSAQNGQIPLLIASILVMVSVVVLLNYQVWLRLYHYSEKRFSLND